MSDKKQTHIKLRANDIRKLILKEIKKKIKDIENVKQDEIDEVDEVGEVDEIDEVMYPEQPWLVQITKKSITQRSKKDD